MRKTVNNRSSVKKKSYLDRLKFDPKLGNSNVAKYITNIRIVLLLVIAILTVGIFGYISLPKRLNPEVKIPIVNITTILPGAPPEDIENLVTVPLENAVKGINGIDTLTSVSRQNLSVITIQFISSVDGEKAKQDVQSEVDTVTDLPEDAQLPKVAALDFEDQPVLTFALSTELSPKALADFSNDLKKDLEDNAKVDRVVLNGYKPQQIIVEADSEKLRLYNLNPVSLSALLKRQFASFPSGDISTSVNDFSLSIDPLIADIGDIRSMKITVSGKTASLSDVANVYYSEKEEEANSFIAKKGGNPRESVTFFVYKAKTANIDDAGEEMNRVIDEKLKEKKGQFEKITILDTADRIDEQFSDLLGEFQSTIMLILVGLFVFLGLRQAVIASFTVPLTFLSSFFLMGILGQSINFLTLFALLIALGLLIDDTIVVVSAMTSYYRTGKFTPTQTGILVWKDTIVPIWSTTLTTIWSFVPLLLTSGIIGEFIKPIPVVVTVTMVSSTAIAVLITLPFMVILLKPRIAKRVAVLLKILGFIFLAALIYLVSPKNILLVFILSGFLALLWIFLTFRARILSELAAFIRQRPFLKKTAIFLFRYSKHGMVNIDPFASWYKRQIYRILGSASARRKVVVAIVTYSILGFAFVPLGFVRNEFFPKTDADEIYINAQFPSGLSKHNVRERALEIFNELKDTQNMDYLLMQTGEEITSNLRRSPCAECATFTLVLEDGKIRDIPSVEISENIRRRLSEFEGVKTSVLEPSAGPPAGADIQIKYLGSELSTLDAIADKTMEYLSGRTGVANIDKSLKPGTGKIVFVPERGKLSENGITVDTLGLYLRTYASGFTLDSRNFDRNGTDSEKTDIVFVYSNSDPTVTGLGRLSVPNTKGEYMPLNALGSFVLKANPTVITREGGKRTVSVTATTLSGFSSTEIGKDLEEFADATGLPDGYEWRTGGVNEENRKSVLSIIQAMGIAFILILVTMVLQFQSYRQAAIVLIVIPLAVSSVFWIFALTGIPLSFPGLIGVLSLFGIVVTNSMFIVDKINLNREEGMDFREAVADAGASRLEPIILTKLSTIVGLLPITLANPLWRGLGGAIISGLLLASSIMLLFIPVVYYSWFSEKKN